MPRMQVYLPDHIYEVVKKRRLPASELLEEAVRAELRRREDVTESERYTAELGKRIGRPTARHRMRAEAIAERVAARRAQRKARQGDVEPVLDQAASADWRITHGIDWR